MRFVVRSRKKLSQDVVNGLGIGLAARGTHHLADEEFEDAFVAGFELGDVVGIFGDDFASGLLNGGGVHLSAEAFGSDDFGCASASFKHGDENFFGDGSGELTGLDKRKEFGKGGG